MNNTFTAQFTQYLMPDGRAKNVTTELPLDAKSAYDLALETGHRMEIEMLSTGEVSATIHNTEREEDVEICVTQNGPEVQQGIVDMLIRFESLQGARP